MAVLAAFSLAACGNDDEWKTRLTKEQKETFAQHIAGEYPGQYIIVYKNKDSKEWTDEEGRHLTEAHEETVGGVQLDVTDSQMQQLFFQDFPVALVAQVVDEYEALSHALAEVTPQAITARYGFAYDDEQVLRGVSFTAKEGEVTALVGPSGSGKSTCARLAARLWDIDQGTIRVGGVDIASVDPEVLLTDYSMVFQDVVLFDDTVMENIRLGRHGASDEEVLAAAQAANCDEFVSKLPEGYATPIGENGAKLSGGERQRISIARALLKNAPIVLLDEATASLDVENETKVQGALSRLLAGKTVLVIAHRMRTVEAADKIVVLAEGRVAEEGSPAELMGKEDGIFHRMTKLQSASAGWSI